MLKSPRRQQLIALLTASLAAALLLAACSSPAAAPHASATPAAAPHASATPVDTRQPEAVLRAYFAAWAQGDWSRERSFMSSNYANLQPEPAASLRVLSVKRVHRTDNQAIYDVRFRFVVKGRIVSMTTGTYDWTYELTWDPARNSWIITNYGEE